ncbi:hypothetical protein WAI453_012708 [Rhynchosporium graminicola]
MPAQLSPTTNRPAEDLDVGLKENDELLSEFDLGRVIDLHFVLNPSNLKALAAMPSAPPTLLSFAQRAFGPMRFQVFEF